jgi:integrase
VDENTATYKTFASQGNTAMLTDTFCNYLKGSGKVQKYTDNGNLYLFVSPAGGKLWRFDYRFAGKRKTLSLGKYPAVSLKSARDKMTTAKELLADDIDPSTVKKTAKASAIKETRRQGNTFEKLALDWSAAYFPTLTPKHADKLRGFLQTIIFPAIGPKPATDIEQQDILAFCKLAESQGRISKAHKLMNLCAQVLSYAQTVGAIPYNVASGLGRALRPLRHKPRSAIVEPERVGRLLRAIYSYDGFPSITAYLKILPYVFTRPSELRLAQWSEINLDDALFTIPWQRLKTRKISQNDHRVPLSRQVIDLFCKQQEFSGYGEFVFPSARSKTATISDGGPLVALRIMGYTQNDICLHGFRSMASTLLNEQGFRPDVIETALSHGDPDKVRAVYNRAAYLDERRQMMQFWADYLDGLRAG